VLWVSRAQAEHDAFCDVMRERAWRSSRPSGCSPRLLVMGAPMGSDVRLVGPDELHPPKDVWAERVKLLASYQVNAVLVATLG
jgi:hypothetical protein